MTRPSQLFCVISAAILCLALASCATTEHKQPVASVTNTKAVAASEPAALQNDGASKQKALAILHEALARCDTLKGYEILFHRQERRGLLPKLGAWEKIKVYYRKNPDSIKMVWLDPESEYESCLYVQGTNDDRVTVLPRKGFLGLPAAPMSVPPQMAVTMGKSLRPITEFGLAMMVHRTLTRLDAAERSGGAKVTYEGIAVVDPIGVKAHHIVILYPPGFGQSAKQDIYIDAQSGYPVGVTLWLPSGELHGTYLYEQPTLVVPSDEVFTSGLKEAAAPGQ